jgi:hypothetical protein
VVGLGCQLPAALHGTPLASAASRHSDRLSTCREGIKKKKILSLDLKLDLDYFLVDYIPPVPLNVFCF